MNSIRFDNLARALAATGTRRRALKGAAVLVVGGALGGAVPAPVLAAQKRTARCVRSADNTSNTGFEATGSRHAQTFRPRVGGPLSAVAVAIDHWPGTSGDYVLEVVAVDAAGAPVPSAVLVRTTLPGADLAGGVQTLVARFPKSTAPTLRSTRRYAVVVGRTGADRWSTLNRIGDACPNSVFYRQQTPGGMVKRDGFDLVFAVSVHG